MLHVTRPTLQPLDHNYFHISQFELNSFSLIVFLHVSGETIKIVIEEYVQQLSGYLLDLKFDPAMLFNSQFQYGNRIALEFSQLYHWHPLMPDTFLIDGDEVPYEQFLYNTSFLMRYGVDKMVEAFSKQSAGQVTHHKQCYRLIIQEFYLKPSGTF